MTLQGPAHQPGMQQPAPSGPDWTKILVLLIVGAVVIVVVCVTHSVTGVEGIIGALLLVLGIRAMNGGGGPHST